MRDRAGREAGCLCHQYQGGKCAIRKFPKHPVQTQYTVPPGLITTPDGRKCPLPPKLVCTDRDAYLTPSFIGDTRIGALGRDVQVDTVGMIVTLTSGCMVTWWLLRWLLGQHLVRSVLEARGWIALAVYVGSTGASVFGGFLWVLVRLSRHQWVIEPIDVAVVGIALGVVLSWGSASGSLRSRWRSREGKAASPEHRRQYARELEYQVCSVTGPDRPVTVTLEGDRGEILVLRGEIAPGEGDRLARSLRDELIALGFVRIEGKGPRGDWWAPVGRNSNGGRPE